MVVHLLLLKRSITKYLTPYEGIWVSFPQNCCYFRPEQSCSDWRRRPRSSGRQTHSGDPMALPDQPRPGSELRKGCEVAKSLDFQGNQSIEAFIKVRD